MTGHVSSPRRSSRRPVSSLRKSPPTPNATNASAMAAPLRPATAAPRSRLGSNQPPTRLPRLPSSDAFGHSLHGERGLSVGALAAGRRRRHPEPPTRCSRSGHRRGRQGCRDRFREPVGAATARHVDAMSGRPGLTTPIARFNGGLLVDRNLETIEQQMPTAGAAHHRPTASHHLDVGPPPAAPTGNVATRRVRHVEGREARTVQFELTAVATYAGLESDVAKIVGVSDDLDSVRAASAAAQKHFADRVSAAQSQPYDAASHAPRRQQGCRNQVAVRPLRDPNSADRHDRRHAQRRADVRPLGLSISASLEAQQPAARRVTAANDDVSQSRRAVHPAASGSESSPLLVAVEQLTDPIASCGGRDGLALASRSAGLAPCSSSNMMILCACSLATSDPESLLPVLCTAVGGGSRTTLVHEQRIVALLLHEAAHGG